MLHSTQGVAGSLKPQAPPTDLVCSDCLPKLLSHCASPLMPPPALWPLFCTDFVWLQCSAGTDSLMAPNVPHRAHGNLGHFDLLLAADICVPSYRTGDQAIEPAQFCVSTSLFLFSWLTNQIFHSSAPWEAPSATDIFDSHTALQRTSQGC